MTRTLLALTAAACFFIACSEVHRLDVSANMGGDISKGSTHFRYVDGIQEVNLYDIGFDGTLDLVKELKGCNERTITPDSSDFPKYDSIYHRVREMATTGEVK
jgi:hypothetical protein